MTEGRAVRNARIATALLVLTACSFGTRAPSLPERSFVPLASAPELLGSGNAMGLGKIKHVVIVIQENRSFDNLFQGYPGADTVAQGRDSKHRVIPLKPVSLKTVYQIDHSSNAMFEDCDGKGKLPGTQCRMDGFDKESVEGGPLRLSQYAYVPHDETKPYFAMAHEWVLSDRTFASQLDESFVAHQYLIAAQAHDAVNTPNGPWGCIANKHDVVATIEPDRSYGGFERPCFNYKTLGDELDAAGLPWRFYTSEAVSPTGGTAGLWSAYRAVRHIRRGPDWKKDVITPPAAAVTGPRGLRPSSIPSARARSGNPPQSSSFGTIGAVSTITSPPFTVTTTGRDSACPSS